MVYISETVDGDLIHSTQLDDWIEGLTGKDQIYGGLGGNDIIVAGLADPLVGYSDDNVIYRNTFKGADTNDNLNGGNGTENNLATGITLNKPQLQPLTAENGLAIAEIAHQDLGIKQSTTSFNDAALTPQNAVVSPSGDYQINALLIGERWDNPTTITYSFFEGGSSYYGPETVSEVSEAVKNNVRTILESYIEPFLNVNFVEVGDSSSSYGQMRYMFSNLSTTNGGYAYAYYPFSSSGERAGDVHLSPNFESDPFNQFSGGPGSHGYMSLIHETLHALGLKHPGPYNAGGGGTPGPYLPSIQDNTTNTVMTYNFTGDSAATPMPFDIKALQYLYGTKSLNNNDTTYAFSSVYGYSANGRSVGSPTTAMKLTILDTGGEDTFDFSALAFNASGYHFNLNQGQINTSQTAYFGTDYFAEGDTSGKIYQAHTNGTLIAYNTVIENINGSSSDDEIWGNASNNKIDGGAGNDSISGLDGADTLLGNSGDDHVYGWSDDDYVDGGTGNDNVDGGGGNDIVNGDLGNDFLTGDYGDDFLDGGAGNDLLIGGAGNDFLIGGLGNDTYYVSINGTPVDTVNESPGGGTDTVESLFSYTLRANLENLTLALGGGAINGIGNTLGNVITGNDADNLLDGVEGNDTLNGGAGNDTLKGNVGNDFVDGGAGNDRVIGGADSDVLRGGSGVDLLTGGLAADKFLYSTNRAFATVDTGKDIITDFVSGLDKIVLDKTTFKSLNSIVGAGFSIGDEFKVVATDAAAAVSKGEIVYSKATNHLFYNQNGTAAGFGTGDLFVTLTGVPSLGAMDFILQA